MEETRILQGVQPDRSYRLLVEPTCLANLYRLSSREFPDMVEYIRGGCMRIRLRRALHSFWKLLKLGWPEKCGDLFLKIWICYYSTNGWRLAETKHCMTKYYSAPFYLVWEVEHEAMKVATPVQAQVRYVVSKHIAGWGSSPAGARPAHTYFPVLVHYLHLRLQCLERHCAVCDCNLQGTGAWFPSLCKSIECVIAMNAPLTVYLYPTSMTLLISFAITALEGPYITRLVIFGDSLQLNGGYWLHGILDANPGAALYGLELHWERIRAELQKAPRFDRVAFLASGNPDLANRLLSPQLLWNELWPGIPVLFRLLNWIVLTFDGVLLPLGRKYMPGLPWWHDIFIVQAGNRERATAFRQRRAAASGRSYFGFYGTHICNWHSILRQDIKNPLGAPIGSSGTAHRPPINVYTDWGTAAAVSEWRNDGFKCLGFCEVVDTVRVGRTQGNGMFMVHDEHDVTIRALLVKGTGSWDLDTLVFPAQMGKGHALATRLRNFLRDTKEYQELCEGLVDGEDVSHSLCDLASAMRPTQ